MKKILAVFVLVSFLCGCGNTATEMDNALWLRNQMLQNKCSFDVTVVADYSEKLYTFSMNCQVDSNGAVEFCVTKPETISGITGTVSEEGGTLTFDNKALLFETIADGLLTPVTAPWVLIKTIRSGYINACGKHDDGSYLQIDDSYKENALHIEIWTDEQTLPERAEIIWEGRRILSMTVENFKFL